MCQASTVTWPIGESSGVRLHWWCVLVGCDSAITGCTTYAAALVGRDMFGRCRHLISVIPVTNGGVVALFVEFGCAWAVGD